MQQPPWTGIGSLQAEVADIRSELRRKAESYEVSVLTVRMDNLERFVRQMHVTFEGLERRLEVCEHRLGQLEEERGR